MAQIWGILKMVQQWWTLLLTFIGMIEKAQHEKKNEEIADNTQVIANPNSTEEQRHDATQNLEDSINKHT